MRQPVPGTVARDQMVGDTHFHLGTVDGNYATTFPSQVTIDMDLLERGRERFMIYCLPCHGVTGEGDGPVHQRAMQLLNLSPTINNGTTWVQPKNLHEEAVVDQPVGQIYYTISNGKNNMAGYASQIDTRDRWAIAAYVQALQVAGDASKESVSGSESLPERRFVMDDDLNETEEANGDEGDGS